MNNLYLYIIAMVEKLNKKIFFYGCHPKSIILFRLLYELFKYTLKIFSINELLDTKIKFIIEYSYEENDDMTERIVFTFHVLSLEPIELIDDFIDSLCLEIEYGEINYPNESVFIKDIIVVVDWSETL